MKMIKGILTALAICATFSLSMAQTNTCDGGRFSVDTTFNDVTVTQGIKFGSNTAVGSNNQEELFLDFYEPTGDVMAERPLIILAFGGSFVGGSRNSGDIVELCTQYAKQGYVCAAIDYRVGFFIPNQVTTTLAVMRGMHDMRAAVRFFYKDAATNGNSYGVDTNSIIIGGVSAGAIAAIHAGYFDKDSEVPAYMANDTAGLGGVEGNSGNPGYSSEVAAVINFSGAIGDTNWIEPGDIPMISLHDTSDAVVPYDTREVAVQGFPTGLIGNGSGSMKYRMDNLGIPNPLWTFPGSGHVSYLQPLSNTNNVIDFTEPTLNDVVCKDVFGVGIEDGFAQVSSFTLYPNPTTGTLYVDLTDASLYGKEYQVEVFDILGKSVLNQIYRNTTSIDLSGFQKGMYVVRISDTAGELKVTTRKVLLSK